MERFPGGGPAQPHPAQSFSSLLILMLLMFVMNSGGGSTEGGMNGSPMLGPSRKVLDRAERHRSEWGHYLHGNLTGFKQPTPLPFTLSEALLPPQRSGKLHDSHRLYPKNITGFLRHASSRAFNLSDPLLNSGPLDSTLASQLHALPLEHPLFHAENRWPEETAEEKLAGERKRNETLSLWDRRWGENNTTTAIFRGVSEEEALERPWRNERKGAEMRGSFEWLPKPPPVVNRSEGDEVAAPLPFAPPKDRKTDLSISLTELVWPSNDTTRARARAKASDFLLVKGALSLDGQNFNALGAHHRPNGTIFFLLQTDTAVPSIDIRPLAGFFPNRTVERKEIDSLIAAELEERVKKRTKDFDNGIENSDDDIIPPPSTTCPLQLVLQLAPLPRHLTQADIDFAEEELQRPTGAPVEHWDVTVERGAWWSWECGVAGIVEGGINIRTESFWRMSINYGNLTLLAQLAILLLLVHQMDASRTPSQLSKVALWTVIMQAFMDAWIFSGHILAGILLDNEAPLKEIALSMMAPGFLACISFVRFGLWFGMSIARVQASEIPRPTPPILAPAAAPPPPSPPPPLPLPDATPTSPAPIPPPPPRVGETLPLPVVATDNGGAAVPPPAMPGAMPLPVVTPILARPPLPLRDIHAESAPSPVLLIFFLFLILMQGNLIGIVFPYLTFLAYLFWVPQIVRNARRGTNRPLRWSYILGTSVARLWLVGYFWGGLGPGKENVLFSDRSSVFQYIVGAQLLQILVLALQDVLGPTFFLPARYAPPPPYDWHPSLPEKDGDVEAGAGGRELGDCPICQEVILREEGPARKEVAVAPCGHVFHTKCLEPWLAIRSVCPSCRARMPPLA